MPAAVSEVLRAALAKALDSSGVKERFANLAIASSKDLTASTLANAIAGDYKRWGDVVRERNITAN